MSKHYHFIGIGGIGMSALANLILNKGCKVSGSDLRSNAVSEKLSEKGAVIFIGHAAEHIDGADYVIYSSAIEGSNPELKEAKRRDVTILQRAQLLAELVDGYTSITIAGAHGKTTATSMIAHLLTRADLKPTTAVGGIVQGADSHAQTGEGEYFVTEVDESDGSFLNFAPNYSVITNIDFEHADYYRNWYKVLEAYEIFIQQTAPNGLIIACGDDGHLRKLINACGRPAKTYGFSIENNIQADQMSFDGFQSAFDCIADGKNLGQVMIPVPGRHNVLNALACIAVGLSLSIDFDVIFKSLSCYRGVQRRFQLKGKVGTIWVIDDYAHHPTEIINALSTAQTFKSANNGQGRLIAIMQPHRYTRLEAFMDDFAKSLTNTDILIITDVYAAGEGPIKGVSSEMLHQKVCSLTNIPVHYLPKANIVGQLAGILNPHDIVLTLGAGDITAIADDLVITLKEQSVSVEQAHIG